MAGKVKLLAIVVFAFLANSSFCKTSGPTKADLLYARLSKIVDKYPDSALQIAKEGYRISAAANDQRGISMAFMQFGYISTVKGRSDSAKLYYKKALEIRKRNKLGDLVVSTYHQLSSLYNDLGIKDSAFFFLFEALRWNNASADKYYDYSGRIHTYLGVLYMDYNDHAQAITYIKKGAAISEKSRDTFGIIMAYTELGNFHFQHDRYDSALYYFQRCELLSKLSSEDNAIADTYNNIALCYAEMGKTQLAISYYRQALSTYIGKNLTGDIALVYLNLGRAFLDIQKYDSGLYYLDAGKALARKTGDLNIVLKCLEYLADGYAKKGDYLKAFEYQNQFSILNDSLMNDEKISQIAEMQTKYETEKKEQQITLLDEKSRTRSAQRNFFIAGSALLLLLLLGSGYYFRQRQKLARKNEEISRQRIATLVNEQEIKTYNAMIDGQEEERKRIAGDLHDRIGSMLSTVKLLFGSLENKVGQYQAENKKQFDSVNLLLDETVAEVRKISHDLNTGMVMSFGLVPALEELCNGIDNSGLIRCKLLAYGMEGRLETQKEIGVYRMVQELVSNILKHAMASNIIIQLNHSEGSLNITVEDNGIGFDVAARKLSGGMGLKNMEARAAKMGGVYHVDSRPGAGTISIIQVPI